MELFDEKTYEKMREDYEEAKNTPRDGFRRAMLGAMPIRLDESEKKRRAIALLAYCKNINAEVIKRVEPYDGVAPREVKKLLQKNSDDLSKLVDVEGRCYEEADDFIKSTGEMITLLEEVIDIYPIKEAQKILARTYTVLALFISG